MAEVSWVKWLADYLAIWNRLKVCLVENFGLGRQKMIALPKNCFYWLLGDFQSLNILRLKFFLKKFEGSGCLQRASERCWIQKKFADEITKMFKNWTWPRLVDQFAPSI